MSKVNMMIWTSEADQRHYLIPVDAVLPDGDYVVRTATGKRIETSADILEPYLVTPEQAKTWLKQELKSTMGELRQSAESHFAKQRASFPDRLLKTYADRTGDNDAENLAKLLDALRDNYEVLPSRFKDRMHEIAQRLREADRTGDTEDDASDG